MKFRVTQAFLQEQFPRIIRIRDQDLSHLLHYKEPDWFLERPGGWKRYEVASNVYKLTDNIALSAGIASLKKGRQVSPGILQKYNRKAKDITFTNWGKGIDTIKERLEDLIQDFIHEIEKGG